LSFIENHPAVEFGLLFLMFVEKEERLLQAQQNTHQ